MSWPNSRIPHWLYDYVIAAICLIVMGGTYLLAGWQGWICLFIGGLMVELVYIRMNGFSMMNDDIPDAAYHDHPDHANYLRQRLLDHQQKKQTKSSVWGE